MPRKDRKRAPRVELKVKVKPEVLEALRLGAAYHGIGHHVYTQWILEEGLKLEAKYYGWKKLSTTYIQGKPGRPPNKEQERKHINHLMRLVDRRIRKEPEPGPPNGDGSP